jgi:hypothetical protein
MTEAKSVHVFFHARANGYFPVDQLIDAVRLINSPYYTFVFDKYGIYSLSIDYNSANGYYWQATRNVFEFSSYKISRSLAIFVPRNAVEIWLTLLEKKTFLVMSKFIWYSHEILMMKKYCFSVSGAQMKLPTALRVIACLFVTNMKIFII